MKICPNCGAQLDDAVSFCPECGNSFVGAPAPVYDPYDHTAEFDHQDISDNKVYCMLIYLAGMIGVIIALLAATESAYIRFNVRQCVKLLVCELLISFCAAVLCWTIIVPIAAGIAMVVLFVIRIICFVRICKGQAKEAPIVCKFGFLH